MFDRIQALKKRDEGFTLIELLIVIIILGILAAIVVFAVAGITDKGNESACKSDANSAQTAVEAYRAQNGSYPGTLGALVPTFLRSDPSGAHTGGGVSYTISYNSATGKVSASGACTY